MNFKSFPHKITATIVVAIVISFGSSVSNIRAQAPAEARVTKETPKVNRARGLSILRDIKQILERQYYDDSFNGIDMDAKFKSAQSRIETLERNEDIYRTIADLLVGLNDSHTIFYPPNLRYRVEYGFSMMTIGNGTFVVDVKSESDAAANGLKPGDQVLEFSGHAPSRHNLWLIHYIIYALEPQEDIKLKVRGADKTEREVFFKSRFISPEQRKKERKKRREMEESKPYTCVEIETTAMACKLRTFAVEKKIIDKMMKEASKHQKLIMDLRGNGGGRVDTLINMAGWFFEGDVSIGTEKRRRKTEEIVAKGRGAEAYNGEVIVLLDSESASASEVFARVLQIEKRGRVVGDASQGAVMTSVRYGIKTETRAATLNNFNVPYYLSGLSISVADLIMSDGMRLEGVGVMPDLPVGPTQLALFERTDPVLARAAELLGAPISPEAAGKYHFLVPKSEDALDKLDDEVSEK